MLLRPHNTVTGAGMAACNTKPEPQMMGPSSGPPPLSLPPAVTSGQCARPPPLGDFYLTTAAPSHSGLSSYSLNGPSLSSSATYNTRHGLSPPTLHTQPTAGFGGHTTPAHQGVWSTDLRADYREWLQANRGISKETSVTYSHAVHGVLKELVAKRIKDGRAGPTSSMNADELRTLIEEQPREAERVIKRDKRSSYFRYLKEFLGLSVEETSHVHTHQHNGQGGTTGFVPKYHAHHHHSPSHTNGHAHSNGHSTHHHRTGSVWTASVRNEYRRWLQSDESGMGLSQEEAVSYSRAGHTLLKKVLAEHESRGFVLPSHGMDKESLMSLLRTRPAYIARIIRGAKSKKMFQPLQVFLRLTPSPPTPPSAVAPTSPPFHSCNTHHHTHTHTHTFTHAVPSSNEVWTDGMRRAFRRWLEEEKRLAEPAAKAFCQYAGMTLRTLMAHRVRSNGGNAQTQSNNLGVQDLADLVHEQAEVLSASERGQAYFRCLEEFLGLETASYSTYQQNGRSDRESEQEEAEDDDHHASYGRPDNRRGEEYEEEDGEEEEEPVMEEEEGEEGDAGGSGGGGRGQGGYPQAEFGGDGTAPGGSNGRNEAGDGCSRCVELQKTLNDRETDAERWRSRCESLSDEVRALHRVIGDLKRSSHPPPAPFYNNTQCYSRGGGVKGVNGDHDVRTSHHMLPRGCAPSASPRNVYIHAHTHTRQPSPVPPPPVSTHQHPHAHAFRAPSPSNQHPPSNGYWSNGTGYRSTHPEMVTDDSALLKQVSPSSASSGVCDHGQQGKRAAGGGVNGGLFARPPKKMRLFGSQLEPPASHMDVATQAVKTEPLQQQHSARGAAAATSALSALASHAVSSSSPHTQPLAPKPTHSTAITTTSPSISTLTTTTSSNSRLASLLSACSAADRETDPLRINTKLVA